ncbi:MAG: right-handed parallel beta-helix repeat-containing protein [Prolixibacteraceae bacterium]
MIKQLKFIFCILPILFTGCIGGELFNDSVYTVSKIDSYQCYQLPFTLKSDSNEEILLNGQPVVFESNKYTISEAGYYEMVMDADTTLFVLFDKERGLTEWGLVKWIPKKPDITSHYEGLIHIIHPQFYVPGSSFPWFFKTVVGPYACDANLKVASSDGNSCILKRGTGSMSFEINDSKNFYLSLAEQNYTPKLKAYTSPAIELTKTISLPLRFGPNALVNIKSDVIITASGSLTFEEGTTVLIDAGINIKNIGPLRFKGTNSNPILISCSNADDYFGGVISEGSLGDIEAEYTFFTRFGKHAEKEYQYGHARQQALFKAKETKLTFENCYFMDSQGQVFYPEQCSLFIRDCLIQRVKTGGQINRSTLYINDSYFSDFPNDGQDYLDEDNDALYLSASNAYIVNSQFMYAKDDGIDTGGNEGGEITIDSCWFEACFHEGIAMSSGSETTKHHTIKNSVFVNCQQGAELGYSSPYHEVVLTDCLFQNNEIGIRYGDNYENNVDGIMRVNGALFSGNSKNYWNMVRLLWAPKNNRLIVD